MRQDITLECLLFIFCNPSDNFTVGVDGCVLMLSTFGEAECSPPLAILATYSGNHNATGGKRADRQHDGVNT